jgi:hypothetical protein
MKKTSPKVMGGESKANPDPMAGKAAGSFQDRFGLPPSFLCWSGDGDPNFVQETHSVCR